jgi:hypothetical protein
MGRQPLLIISRRDIMDLDDGPERHAALRALAQLTRQGYQLVSTASLSNDWSKNLAVSSRSHPGPKGLRQLIEDAGGVLDAVYYVPQSLLTQKTLREGALKDILSRFGATPEDCYLLSSGRKLVAIAASLGIRAHDVGDGASLASELTKLLENGPLAPA